MEEVFVYASAKFKCPHCEEVNSVIVEPSFFKSGQKVTCNACLKYVKVKNR